jgi:hypothetical protein
MGATEISNSWDGEEPVTDSAVFNHPGVVITAASGDNGYLNWQSPEPAAIGHVGYPASSPHVVAVGGTRLSLTSEGAWAGESVWNGYGATGSGCSETFGAPPWQQELPNWSAVGCGSKRAVADVSADADPYTGARPEGRRRPRPARLGNGCRHQPSRATHSRHLCSGRRRG